MKMINVFLIMIVLMTTFISAQLTKDESDALLNIEKIVESLESDKDVCIDIKNIISKPNMNVFGTEYQVGDEGTIFLQLLSENKTAISDASCYLFVYYPNKTLWLNQISTSYLNHGIFYRDITIPQTTGVYIVSSHCHLPAHYLEDTYDNYSKTEVYENITISGGVASISEGGGGINIGNISGTLSEFEFDVNDGNQISMVNVTENIYAIAYEGYAGDGFVKTIYVHNNGTINGTIDFLEFDTSDTDFPNIIHIKGNIYAIVHAGKVNDGYLVTFSINSTGEISNTIIEEWGFEGGALIGQKISRINNDTNNVFAIHYRNTVPEFHIKTVEILSNGTVKGQIDDYIVNTDGASSDLIHLQNDIYALAYQSAGGGNSTVATVNITSDGNVIGLIQNLSIDDLVAQELLKISNNVFVDAYSTGASGLGYIQTFDVTDTGSISQNDLYSYNLTEGAVPEIVRVSGEVYAIDYETVGMDGYIQTVTIYNNGSIGDFIDEYLYSDYRFRGHFIHLSNDLFVSSYADVDGDGWTEVINISIISTPDEEITFGYLRSKPLNLTDLYWRYFTAEDTLNDGIITYHILNSSNDIICNNVTSGTDLFSCAGGTTPIKFYAEFSRPIHNDTSPELDYYRIEMVEGQIEEVRGAGELHISNYVNELNTEINEVANEVWNYNGTISANILSQFTDAIWTMLNTTYDFIGLITESVWTRTDRNLTYYEPTTTAEDVWTYIDRNLTYTPTYPTPNNLTAQDVWVYGTRELTYYPTTNLSLTNESIQAIGSAVWSYSGNISDNVLVQVGEKVQCYVEQILNEEDGEWGIDISAC